MDANKEGHDYEQFMEEYHQEKLLLEQETLTNWINFHLKDSNLQVNDLVEDLKDGKILNALINTLYNKKLSIETENLKIHKLSNVEICLNFLRGKINLRNVEALDIVNGNQTLILGMLWSILRNYEGNINDPNNELGKDLLEWCKERLVKYDINIEDFKLSWKSGDAFNAIMHSENEKLFNMENLRGKSYEYKLKHAFRVAALEYKVPPLLDIEEFLSGLVDEKCVIAYLNMIRKSFVSGKYKQKYKLSPLFANAIVISSFIAISAYYLFDFSNSSLFTTKK